jgi:ATP-dependent Lhr-like helicase
MRDATADADVLGGFHPAVAAWFCEQFGEPTAAQRLGWPVIASGRNALIVAPTGSGKTLAAFLAALDYLWRTTSSRRGVGVLYVSPLKALNEDVSRNLQGPLAAILAKSQELGAPLPPLRVGVRSGDTPTRERVAMVRKPPDILITTPESLHHLLTSRAREVLRGLSHVIVDEIHAVCSNKRGVFLALLLERLAAINRSVFVRIGLSATQRPLEEVARYLGGFERVTPTSGEAGFQPRPVTIVDAGWRRNLDLEVIWPRTQNGPSPPGSIWPEIESQLAGLVRDHRSTIIFANNRRTVEKLTAKLNDAAEAGSEASARQGEFPPAPLREEGARRSQIRRGGAGEGARQTTTANSDDASLAAAPLSPQRGEGARRAGEGARQATTANRDDASLAAAPPSPPRPAGERSPLDAGGEGEGEGARRAGEATPLYRAHHGSISLAERRATEDALKRGEVKAVVATASLELGIDMGAVDLVCQVESPGNVARGLQRVGRAGHVVRGVGKGRLIAKTPADLLETAALCRAMIRGEIETSRVPHGCLDVLAQQLVACVAMESWDAHALYDLVRSAYPYRNLAPEAFESVLNLISGRFPTPSFRDLRARVVWDRIHNRLASLPGTAQVALVGGGTIPDTGQYPVYLGDGGPRLGELDEEFVFERRVGETFVLGNSTWRIEALEPHRLLVSKAEGEAAVMPFWRGESTPRSPELGEAVGRLSHELVERLDDPELASWLASECRLTSAAAKELRGYFTRQQRVAGACPDHRTIMIESFPDLTGECSLAVLTPFGGRLHHALRLVLSGRIRERFGFVPAAHHADDGLLFRIPSTDEPPLDLFEGLTPEIAERLLREELPHTALFGLRFRQNAYRALLMPRPDPTKRTPLWLQRLRAKDLLQVARQFPDFPIVVETVRECLDDDLELPRLRALLAGIQAGTIRVVRRDGQIPSPFTSELIFLFTAAHLYEWDQPVRSDRGQGGASVDVDLLATLLREGTLADRIDPQAIGRVENRLRNQGRQPRTAEEMAEYLRVFGDLAPSEVSGGMAGLLDELERAGRAVSLELPDVPEPSRWILAEEEPLYCSAFMHSRRKSSRTVSASGGRSDAADEEARETIVMRFLRTRALVGLVELTKRYPISAALATERLERWAEDGRVIRVGENGSTDGDRWADRENLAEVLRTSVAIRRRESLAVQPEVFADFLLRIQHLHPATRGTGLAFVDLVLDQLQGHPALASGWESDIFPRRVTDYRPGWLDEALDRGQWLWRARGEGGNDRRVAFFRREFSGTIAPDGSGPAEISQWQQTLLDILDRHGATYATDLARRSGLEPSRVRRALEELVDQGLVTNDRFEPMRTGSNAALLALDRASSDQRAGRLRRRTPRRPLLPAPEGRWSRLELPADTDETGRLAWAAALLGRYGVLTREILALETWAPAWSDLAPLLARAEWRGEVRRGFFVEGLSGVQYATDEAAAELVRLSSSSGEPDPLVWVSTTDPANLYGSGAPFDIDLLGGGTARLPRIPGNSLVLRQGRPVLIIESHARRLTALPAAARTDIDSALNFLPNLTGPARRVLKVETYNGAAVIDSVVAPRLAELGFVRDYPGMTYYAGWPQPARGPEIA